MSNALRLRAEMLLDGDRSARTAVQASVPASQIVRGTEMFDILTGAMPGGAGVPVTDRTAMCVSAVYASIALIGTALAALPFHLYRNTPKGRERWDDDLWYLFNESPWPTWTAASAWMWAAQCIGLRGDAHWRIRRVTPYTNAIQGFEPAHPDGTRVERKAGRNIYTFYNEDGTTETLDQDDVLHFPGIGFDGQRSITPIRAALRLPAGIALAADEYAGAFFRNGARADFALTTDNSKINEEQANIIRATWASRHQGPQNAHLPAVLTGGLKVQQLTLSAEDAQLLSTRQFQVEDIARAFGVPPHMIGHTTKATSWGTGIEQLSLGFLRYTMRRYIDPVQQETKRKLWPKSSKVFGEFNVDALLEGDSKTQGEYFGKALGGPGTQGWMTINEVRRLKNLPPVPGGDRLIIAGSQAGAPNNQEPAEPDPAPEDPDQEDDDAPDA